MQERREYLFLHQ